LPFEKISTYFGFSFQGDLETKFENTITPYIAIPYTTAKILGMEIGDQVTVFVSRQIPELTFTVAGFINTNYTGMAFTNLCNLPEYNTDDYYNTLMINTTDSAGESVKHAMMKAYNARMYYVMDTDETVSDSAEEMLAVTDYLSFLALAIAFAFIIVIINNSLLVFYSLRPIYAKMKVMGLSTSELLKEIGIEIGIMVLILFVTSSLCLLILVPSLGPLMLFLHYYKVIQIPAFAIVGRVLFGSAVFAFSFIFYFFKARSINVIQEIKKY
jgi:ABC-type antimicrobial peptide transport system permease subunit